MMTKRRFVGLCCLAAICTLLLSVSAVSAGPKNASVIDQKADAVLRGMCEYLAALEHFSFHTENTIDAVVSPGLKLQFAESVDAYVRRPDRLRANATGDIRNQDLYYDGKSITLTDTDLNFYGTINAPPEIESALDHALESFDIEAPLADLLYRDLYDNIVERAELGFYVGLHSTGGVECHHLAFVGEDVNCQIWVENSKTPLPRKIIITSTLVAGSPQFTALLSDWNVSARLPDSLFSFVEPEGVEKIGVLRAAGSPATDK
jgi:hypothetical protein